ncbi:hypothetical protein FCOIX_4734 [Fusarium coicis]|nr:hypothetical protein FCOIX_4734 [Fusarium coicis]
MTFQHLPSARNEFTVVVPMAVQALVVAQDFPQTSAQFAPLIEPDYATLLRHPKAGAPVHDLMDDLDLSYWRMQARYSSRFISPVTGEIRPERCGIYLSWCLPRLYRASITATESALAGSSEVQGNGMQQWDSRRVLAGFKCHVTPQAQSTHDQSVQFRPVPDRWIVVRKVRGSPSLTKHVLVESNCIRTINIGDDDMAEDFESTTCPAMDPSRTIEEQLLLRMGRSRPLTAEPEKMRQEEYREPFNAFELGHEYFADYAPHNMGVFTYFDNLEGVNEELIDYSVIGFHSWPQESDPFTFVDADKVIAYNNGNESTSITNKDLLDALHLKVSRDSPIGTDFARKSATIEGRTLTQGILRNVRWNRAESQGLHWPSASLQRAICVEQPIAIGTHMLDALEAYLHLAVGPNNSVQAARGSGLSHLGMRVFANEDDPGSLRKAAEDSASQSFLARPESIVWVFPKDGSQDSSQESEMSKVVGTLVPRLNILNQGQRILDTCIRERKQLMQCLFNCWWNAASICNVPSDKQQLLRSKIQQESSDISKRLQELDGCYMTDYVKVNSLKSELEALLPGNKKLEGVPTSPYGQHQDPNVVVAGAKSGWPNDFNDVLPVRLAAEICPEVSHSTLFTEDWLENKLGNLSAPITTLLRELDGPSPTGAPNPYVGLEDMKDTQGWFPLFVEWQLEYYHVPFERWRLESNQNTGQWRYVIPTDTGVSLAADSAVGNDMRVISGRTEFLPEPGKTLQSRLEQLFSQTPASGSGDERRRAEILEAVGGLEYFSASLSGLSDHLVTLRRGHHPRPKADDSVVNSVLGIKANILQELEESGPAELAPYGLSTPLSPEYTSRFSPLKPVTHGQARFTKFAIVDKFGQVVSGISLGPQGDGAMYPSISPSLSCDVLPALENECPSLYWPNTVVQAERTAGSCQFFQIPPRINQPARLNTHFLAPLTHDNIQTSKGLIRQVATEWDNPIWAWVLPNFHNHSIQVYDPDGEFVIEILLRKDMVTPSDGPNKAISRPPLTGRLRILVAALRDPETCSSLFDMLAGASDNVSATGADFDQALPAALGRPFCISDVGVSLELSAPPLTDASLLSCVNPERNLCDYSFPVALGNHQAAFDGLVGTFSSSGDIGKISSAFTRDEERLTMASNGVMNKRRDQSEHPQPLLLNPYFLPGTLGGNLDEEHRKRLVTVSAIVDPKTPIHVYSGSLFPAAALSLPRWPVDNALRKMRAFFAIGPILVPTMPPLADNNTTDRTADNNNAAPTVQMPLGGGEGSNTWRWLQPRRQSDQAPGELEAKWSEVAIIPLDKRLNVEEAHKSGMIEGYVIVRSDVKAPRLN